MRRLRARVMILLQCSSAACADGKLKATEKTLVLLPGGSTGYFFARVENVGDAPIGTDSGDLVIFSEDDEILLSDSYVTTTPTAAILAPGEWLYVREYLWDNALKDAAAGDFKFSIAGQKRTSGQLTKIPCEAVLAMEGAGSYDNHVHVTFTNVTGSMLDDFSVAAAAYDAQGTLLFVETTYYSSLAIHPGSAATVTLAVDSDLVKYYAAVTPVRVEAYVCITD